MCDPTEAGSASIEENDLSTYLKLLKECKTSALRIFTRHKDMFPQGLLQLSSLDPTVANGPLHCKIEFLRDQIEYLKSVDATPISGPGL